MLRNIYIAATAFLTICLVGVTISILACDDSAVFNEEELGAVASKTFGEECTFDCFEDWCQEVNFPICETLLCVGEPDDLYCTEYCLNENSCYDGYRCTWDCNMNTSEPFCVSDQDYELLQQIGVCPG